MIGAAEETREVSRRTYGDLRELVTLRSGSPFRKTKQSIAGERALTAAGRQLDIEASFRPQSATKLGLKVLVGATATRRSSDMTRRRDVCTSTARSPASPRVP